MHSHEEVSRVRSAIQTIRMHLEQEHGREKGFYLFADYAPGIVSEILRGNPNQAITEKVDRMIAERAPSNTGAHASDPTDTAELPPLTPWSPPKPNVRLLTPGKLSGGLTIPADTICAVYGIAADQRRGDRVAIEVVAKGNLLFEVFEDETEYVD